MQYRVDNGAWVDWLTGTTETSAGFAGEMGHVYHFRLRTWDNVGNERPYPETPDATTRIAAPVTKYYYANGQRACPECNRRVALRQGDVVYYIHTDHPSALLRTGLGSTSVLSDGSGQQAGDRVAYLPYGGLRLGEASTLPTDYTFTGQRNEAGLGLMHYGARFYSPRLGRFISPDTIVPEHRDRQAAQWPLRVGVFKLQDIARVGEENRQTAQYGFWFQRGPEAQQETVHPTGPTNPQELNRYAYCLENPLRYVDPSGEQEEFEMFWPWELYKIDAAGVRVNVSYSPFNAVVAGNLSVDVFYNLQDEKLGVFVTPGGVGGAFFGPGDVTVAFLEISDLPSTAEYSGWTAAAGGCIAGGEIGGAAEWNIALSENSEGKKTQSWTIGWAGGGEVALYGGAGRTMQLAEVDKAFQATVFPGGIRVFGRVLAPELHINLKPLFEPH